MHKNKLITKKQYHAELAFCIETLEKKILGHQNIISKSKNLKVISGTDAATVVFELDPSNRIEHIVLSMLRIACDRAEALSGCSSQILTKFVLAWLRYGLKNQGELSVDSLEKLIFEHTSICKPEDLIKIVMEVCEEDKWLSSAILETMSLAGFEGKIVIDDKTCESTLTIEHREGFVFQTLPTHAFYNQPNNRWDQENVKVLLVDGIVESVSELHGILMHSSQRKIPMLLVAHGFSEEIIATLKANQTYNNFNIIPVRVPSELETINLLNDLAVVCNANIVSSLKGEMLQLVDYDSLPVVDFVTCWNNNLKIINPSSKESVSSHIRTLLIKREEKSGIQDLEDLIDKRIKALISNSVLVKLPNVSEPQKDAIKANLDFGFRTAKAALNFGVLNVNNFLSSVDNPDMKKILSSSLVSNKPIPALAVASAIKLGASTAKMLLSASALLIKEDD